MRVKFLILLIIMSCLVVLLNSRASAAIPAISDDSARRYIYEGFKHLYNFEFRETDSIIKYSKQKLNYSPWTYILTANYYWWKIISGEPSENNKISFYNSLENARLRIKNRDLDESKFLLVLIYSFKARVELMEEKYVNPILELKKHLNIITGSFGKEEKFPAFYLTSGLYYYLSDIAYSNYIFLRPFLYLFPSGNKELGISYLNKKTGDFILETESQYFLMKIYEEVENNPLASMRYAKALFKKYPQNYIFMEQYYRLLAKTTNKPISSRDIDLIKTQILRNKQLSVIQRTYFIQITKKLQNIPS